MERMDAVDMPLGLTMSLAEDLDAMQTFSNLSPEGQAQIVTYIQGSVSGEDAKERIERVVNELHDGLSLFDY